MKRKPPAACKQTGVALIPVSYTHLDVYKRQGIASRLAAESLKLHQYLASQRLIRRSEPIPVYMLAHPQAVATVRQACVDAGSLQYQILDSHQAAKKLGLKTLPGDSSSELIFLHLLAAAPPRQQLSLIHI